MAPNRSFLTQVELGSKIIPLREGEAHLWTQTLASNETSLKRAWAILSDTEKAQAARFIHETDRNRYLVCHSIVREILAQYLEVPPDELTFETNQFGKPQLSPDPAGSSLNFNLAHSGDRMLLGITLSGRIGVDIEEIRAESASLEVAARFFTDRENRELRSLTGLEQVQGFFNCWTRKEAYLKALGCGLSIEPNEVEVTLIPGDPPRIRRHVAGEDRHPWSLFHFSTSSFISSIASDKPVQLVVREL